MQYSDAHDAVVLYLVQRRRVRHAVSTSGRVFFILLNCNSIAEQGAHQSQVTFTRVHCWCVTVSERIAQSQAP